jgi:hypothetical protein
MPAHSYKGSKMAQRTEEQLAVYREEFAAILPAVERWHIMAVRHSRIAIWCAACCGHELLIRKKEIGHGGWMKFIKVLSFSDDTARRYMDLAVEWKARVGQIPHAVRNLEANNILAAGSRAFIDLPESEIKEISEATTQAVGETTLRQLYFDWGICKAPYHPGGNMRKGDGKPAAVPLEMIQLTWRENWNKMVPEIYDQGIRKKTWVHLEDGELREHAQSLRRVLQELDEEIKRRDGKRK